MREKLLVLASLLCLSGWIAPGFARPPDDGGDLAIIVNASCSLNEVSSAELVRIFKGQKTKNPDGVRYLLASLGTGSPERAAALKGIYGMTDAEYDRYFLQATFAGTVQSAPRILPDGPSLRQFVASTPGAIGYLFAKDAGVGVKILKVDGKSPGDAGYPLSPKPAAPHS